MRLAKWHVAVIALALGFTQTGWAAAKSFYLHSGDRVLFYGDSIVERLSAGVLCCNWMIACMRYRR